MKVMKTGAHNVILYDSNKITLSCLTLTPKVEVTIKENVSISYYDNQRKFWNVYTNPHEYSKVVDILKNLNVSLKPALDVEKDFIENNEIKTNKIATMSKTSTKEDKETDTDSSMNHKRKDSILKRMATMGQSVLPPNHLGVAQTSDSSDTNETYNQHKTRHKHRTISKRNIEKSTTEIENDSESQMDKITLRPNNAQQIIPMRALDFSNRVNISESPDVNLLISEQRVSNSELRINMNRMTDKLDLLLDKVKDIQDNSGVTKFTDNSSANFQNEIVYKLLNEYENKIKQYEEFHKLNGLDFHKLNQLNNVKNITTEPKVHEQDKTQAREELLQDNDKEIYKLKEQIKMLSKELNEQKEVNIEKKISVEVNELKEKLIKKEEEIQNLHLQLGNTLTFDKNTTNTTNKVKEIMNNTFQNISANFDNETNYSGAAIKTIVASIIKKTTIDYLNDV